MAFIVLCYCTPMLVLFGWALAMLVQKGSSRVHRLGAYTLIVMAISFIFNNIQIASTDGYSIWVEVFYGLSLGLFGPLHYMFTIELTKPRGMKMQDHWICVPVLCLGIFVALIFFALTPEQIDKMMMEFRGDVVSDDHLASAYAEMAKIGYIVYIIVVTMPVIIWSIFKCRGYINLLQECYTDVQNQSTEFIRTMSLFSIVMALLLVFVVLAPPQLQTNSLIAYLSSVLLAGAYYLYGKNIYQIEHSAKDMNANVKDVLEKTAPLVDDQTPAPTKKKKDKANDICSKEIIDRVWDEKIFMDRNLDISDVQEILGVEKNILIRSIKYYYDTNLSGLFRKYRIQFAIDKINSSTGQITVASLSQECGYDDITIFLTDFKNATGFSLKEYLASK